MNRIEEELKLYQDELVRREQLNVQPRYFHINKQEAVMRKLSFREWLRAIFTRKVKDTQMTIAPIYENVDLRPNIDHVQDAVLYSSEYYRKYILGDWEPNEPREDT